MQDNQTPNAGPIPPPPGIGYQPRRKSRWWIPFVVIGGLIVLLIVAFGVFISVIVGGLEGDSKPKEVRDRSVLVIELSGGLPEHKPAVAFNLGDDGPRGPSLFDVVSAVRRAKTDEKIKGLYIRSGGSGFGMAKLTELRDALLDFKSSGKFVYAFIDAGSKPHYYIASVADSIVMPQEGVLEFNAFGASAPFMKGLFDKLGVSFHVEQFEEYKSAAETMSREGWSEPAKEELRALILQRRNMFVDAVAKARKMDPATVLAILDRGMYAPDSLLASGLIDGFAREEEYKERIHRRMNPDDTSAHPKLRSVSVNQYNAGSPSADVPEDKGIAIVYASGAISSGKNNDPFSAEGIYSRTLIKDLRAAAENTDVDVIILRIDSPGGSAYASDEIWAAIKEIRKTKPVYASMSDVAASGGYYIAMACDTIISHPATITGSIGVIMAIPNLAGTMNKIGVTVDSVSLGASSTFLNPTMPFSDADKKQFRALGQGIYQRFVQKVADSRGKDYESTRTLARGRVWTGEAAASVGLIDVQGGLFDAIKLAKKRIGVDPDTKVNLYMYPEKVDKLQAILRIFNLDDEEEADQDANAATVHKIVQRVVGGDPVAANLVNTLPPGMKEQVLHVLRMTAIATKERTLTMLPSHLPLD